MLKLLLSLRLGLVREALYNINTTIMINTTIDYWYELIMPWVSSDPGAAYSPNNQDELQY